MKKKRERKYKFDWKWSIPFTFIGLGLMLLPVFLYRDYGNGNGNWTKSSQEMFVIFGELSFIFGAFLIGFPVFYGRYSIATMFFGGSYWSNMSKLFYGMIMIQML